MMTFSFVQLINLYHIHSRYDQGSGNLIAFTQFLFIAIEGLVMHSKFFTVKSVIPIRYVD